MDFDFQLVNSLSQTASGVAGAIRQTADAVARLKGLAKPSEGRSDAEIESAVDQVALAVENANLKNQLLEAQVTILSDAIRKANEAQAQLERYRLHETQSGEFVYLLKETDGAGEPAHSICPTCFQNGRKSILHGDRFLKRCEPCEATFHFDRRPNPPSRRVAVV